MSIAVTNASRIGSSGSREMDTEAFGIDGRRTSDTADNWDEGLLGDQAKKLFYLNIAATIVQLGSGCLIFFLTDTNKTYTIYTTFPCSTPDNETSSGDTDGGPPFLAPVPKEFFSVGVGYLSAAFLFLSALDHLIVCTCGKKAYESGLDRSYNIFRWVEYALSASVMRVIVGILSGVVDFNQLLLIFGHTAVTMIFGLVFELENQGKRLQPDDVRWYTYWLGFVSHTFGWATIIWYFIQVASAGNAPGFVYAIVVTVFLLDLTFPIALGLQWRAKGIFRAYSNGEILFIILSFTSKNLLAWINFIGGNR